MKTDFQVIILGLGGIGSGAAYWAAKRFGGDVLGLEQFALGHDRGGSQDHSRIIRLSYHTPNYVTLARQAYQAWAAMEADLGEKLIIKTGGLDLFPAGGAIPSQDYRQSLDAGGVPYEWLDAAAVMRRWPHFHLEEDVQAIFQADSGILPAAKCNAAHLWLARGNGAVLKEQQAVTALADSGGEITVVTGSATYHCRKLIITAGAWSNHLLAHFGRRLPLTITQEQVTYFATHRLDDFRPERIPVWIWLDDPSYYGFPVFGEAGTKVAQDVGGAEVTAETRSFTPDADNLQRMTTFLQRVLPGALGPVIYSKTCLYTLTPDRDFVIDALPEHPAVAVAIGAGHGFKFASLMGKLLAEWAADEQTGMDLTPFRLNRPVLLDPNPPKRYLV